MLNKQTYLSCTMENKCDTGYDDPRNLMKQIVPKEIFRGLDLINLEVMISL